MAEDDNHAAILKAAKERVKQSEEQHIVQMLATAIGERRDRDLLDLLSQSEQEKGWPETLELFTSARESSYALPVGAGLNKIKVEDLKYREMLFSILGCRGLEPTDSNTTELLTRMKDDDSLVDASSSLHEYIESAARLQIESGDTLFFASSDFDAQISETLLHLLEHVNNEAGKGLTLERKNRRVNIYPLWQCEPGRQILSEHGIKGFFIDMRRLEEVLSVIQYPITINAVNEYTIVHTPPAHPFNLAYRDLHNYIILHDSDGLCTLSSRHSFATLRFMLEEALDIYTKNSLSKSYRRIVNLIHMHIRVRTIDSIELLERLAFLKDNRIATVAITALGNFYHESTISVLIELLCKSRNREITQTTTNALLNIGTRRPEINSIVERALETSTCLHRERLKRLLAEFGKKNPMYY